MLQWICGRNNIFCGGQVQGTGSNLRSKSTVAAVTLLWRADVCQCLKGNWFCASKAIPRGLAKVDHDHSSLTHTHTHIDIYMSMCVCVLMSHSKTQLSVYFINPADCFCYWQQMVGDFLISPSCVYFQLSLYLVHITLLNSAALFFPVSWLCFIFICHFLPGLMIFDVKPQNYHLRLNSYVICF